MNNIYLTGMMGCGKTTLGRMLAQRLCREFVDVDEQVERAEKTSISAIFREKGEAYFRNIEKQTLRQIARGDDLIVACGGGIVLDAGNVALMMETGTVVYIERPLQAILQDIDAGGRPLLQKNNMEELYESRKPLYEQSCNIKIHNGSDAGEAIRSICDALWTGD